MARRRAFYDQDYRQHIGAVIMCITSFVAVALATCGTPLGMLMIREWTPGLPAPGGDYISRPCYTLWGKRNNCWNANYSMRITDETISSCRDIRNRLEAAEAFSIIAIFALLFVLGAAWYKICGSKIKSTVTMLSVFSIGSTTVPWAVVTAFYYTPFCGLEFLTHRQTYLGAGYVLLVTSFAVQVVGLVLFVALEPEDVAKPSHDDSKAVSDASSSAAGSN